MKRPTSVLKASDTSSQRAFARAIIKGRVLIHDDQKLFIAPIANISAGGVFVKELVNLPVGRAVRLVVKSPQLDGPVAATGTVVRVEESDRKGIAVRFTVISRGCQELINECVFQAKMESALQAA